MIQNIDRQLDFANAVKTYEQDATQDDAFLVLSYNRASNSFFSGALNTELIADALSTPGYIEENEALHALHNALYRVFLTIVEQIKEDYKEPSGVSLQYNPTQEYPWHIEDLRWPKEIPHGWAEVARGVSEDVASAFVEKMLEEYPKDNPNNETVKYHWRIYTHNEGDALDVSVEMGQMILRRMKEANASSRPHFEKNWEKHLWYYPSRGFFLYNDQKVPANVGGRLIERGFLSCDGIKVHQGEEMIRYSLSK